MIWWDSQTLVRFSTGQRTQIKDSNVFVAHSCSLY